MSAVYALPPFLAFLFVCLFFKGYFENFTCVGLLVVLLHPSPGNSPS